MTVQQAQPEMLGVARKVVRLGNSAAHPCNPIHLVHSVPLHRFLANQSQYHTEYTILTPNHQ